MSDFRFRPDFGGILRPPHLKFSLLLASEIALHGFNELSVAPLLPRALNELRALQFLPWSYALFFAAVIAGGVTASGLRARMGARMAILVAASLYLLSILLCVSAQSGTAILIGRALQGLADGWIAALGYGLIPDMFGTSRVSRVVAFSTVIWAGSSMLGPTLSGVVVDLRGWRAGFLLSVPIVVTMMGAALLYAPRTRGAASELMQKRQLGILSCALVSMLMVMVPSALPDAPLGFLWPLFGMLCLVMVLRADAKAANPLIPHQLFRLTNTVGIGSWVLLLITAGQSISTVFLAFVIGTIFELPARSIGLVLIVLPLCWVISGFPTGQIRSVRLLRGMLRLGPRWQAIGAGCVIVGLTSEHLALVVVGQTIIGLGLGTIWGPLNHAIVVSADEHTRPRIASLIPSITTAGYIFGSGMGSLIAGHFRLFEQVSMAGAPSHATIIALWGMVLVFSLAAAFLIVRVQPEGEAAPRP